MNWTKFLRCPRCKTGGIEINPNPIEDVVAATWRGDLHPMRCTLSDWRLCARHGDNPTTSGSLTLAGLSNYLPCLPWGYENVWRPRSLTQLSGENFPVEREIKLLNDWLAVQPRELVIDLGSSTDLYRARRCQVRT